MANKSLFQSLFGKLMPQTDTVNEAGGRAYQFSDKHALAQYAATGCLNATYYASDREQLETVLKLCRNVEPEFIARTAVFARERGHMKDMPALLCAVLSVKGPGLLCEIFERVLDNGKMLQNFVQIMRSGVAGRKSLGTAPKKLVQKWLEKRSDEALFRASVGQNPSLSDIIKMVHPTPKTPAREALYGYLIGAQHNAALLPKVVKEFEAFKRGEMKNIPDVPFQMLTALELGETEWTEIARNAPWQMTRMNLNTFARHGVFKDEALVEIIANRLRDAGAIAKARVFPYQLMTAYAQASVDVPVAVREALQDAMEIALQNVPAIAGKVCIFPDVSGSMHSPATGHRKGATSVVRCIDVAALVAAALARRNPGARIVPFSDHVVDFTFNARDSVLTNAEKLAKLPSGGTNCSAPLAYLNKRREAADLIVYVSDNQSWVDTAHGGNATATMSEFAKLKTRCPQAKMVCIDIQPYATTQASDREDVLNVGGFSDQVFEVIGEFAAGGLGGEHWVSVIERVKL